MIINYHQLVLSISWISLLEIIIIRNSKDFSSFRKIRNNFELDEHVSLTMVNIEARMMEHERQFRLLFRIDGRSVDIYDSLSIGRNVKKKKRDRERNDID